MDFESTVVGMLSDDYEERFVAEFQQLKIRLEALKRFIGDVEHKKADVELRCPLALLKMQAAQMQKYLNAMIIRAYYEEIEL